MCGTHSVPTIIEDIAGQYGWGALQSNLALYGASAQPGLYSLKECSIHNGRMFSRMNLAPICDFGNVKSVSQ
jgi:hypothetical protein